MINIRNESGFVLPYLLITILLISTLLVITINLFTLYNKYEVRKYNKNKLDLACYSAVQKFIAEDTLKFIEKQTIQIDSTGVDLLIKQKGLYYNVTATAKNKNDSSKVEYLLAERMQEPFDNAIVITRSNLNAAIAGKTKIVGNILGTTDKVKKGKIAGIAQAGDNYLEGNVRTAPMLLPNIYNDSLLIKDCIKWKKPHSIKEIIYNENITASSYFFIQNDTTENIVINGTLTLTGSIINNRKTKKLFVKGKTIIESGTKINSNLEIFCDSTVLINDEAYLQNILISAKGKIVINAGALCKNIQLISQRGIECNKVVVKFPSVLCLSINPADTSKQKSTIALNKSRINGTLMLLSSDVTSNKNKSKIVIDANSSVQGLVYSENNVEIYGKLVGTLYTQNILYYKKPTEYTNWLVDLSIDRKRLDNYFMIPIGFNKRPHLEILKETWLN